MNTQEKSRQVITQQESEPQSSTVGFRKILVAVDYLASTPQIFEVAMQLAQTYESRLMVFHSVQGEMPGMPEMITATSMGAYCGVYSTNMIELEEQLIKEATEELQAWLRSFSRRATEQGIPTEYDYQIGDPGPQICALAKSWEADLIVIGRRGRSGLSEIFLGSVSNYVVHHAHCSVLVVQH
ncbi:MAG: universal stress protein [Xenococcaceae cyanobacterium]